LASIPDPRTPGQTYNKFTPEGKELPSGSLEDFIAECLPALAIAPLASPETGVAQESIEESESAHAGFS
jgi:hypothetical protein